MGCTSSAPPMPTANATDKNITFLQETAEKPMEKINHMSDDIHQTKAIIEHTVLPTCDTDTLDKALALPLYQMDKAMSETSSQWIDKDVQTDCFRIDNDNSGSASPQTLQEGERTPKLEEMVEQVVEMLISGHNTEAARNTPEPEPAPAEMGTDDACEPMEANVEQEVDHGQLEEAISPSQSESSRATRWEALADVAAELPPSLAVDPLTGQIYTFK